MENEEKNKQGERFPDVNTPSPPQEMEPTKRSQSKSPDPSNIKKDDQQQKERQGQEKEGKKLLGESEIEIDDETTI